jgi:hypothetical protein
MRYRPLGGPQGGAAKTLGASDVGQQCHAISPSLATSANVRPSLMRPWWRAAETGSGDPGIARL